MEVLEAHGHAEIEGAMMQPCRWWGVSGLRCMKGSFSMICTTKHGRGQSVFEGFDFGVSG